MIIYVLVSTLINIIGAVVWFSYEPTTFFGIETYIAQFSGTVRDFGIYFPPVSTLFNCILIVLAVILALQSYKWGMRLYRMIRG